MSVSSSHGDRPAHRPGGTRSPVLATNGMVATSQPLASAAALAVLEDGGNAVDASIAAAAVLNVVEPTMTGIGGDMFALVFMQREGRLVGLNGSGWSGSKAALDAIPGSDSLTGIRAVTVPGAVSGWFKLHERYGTFPISRLVEPAIRYARDGFPVSEIIAGQWERIADYLRTTGNAKDVYLPAGRAVKQGEVFRNPSLARSFQLLVDEGVGAFYKGPIADAIVRTSDAMGGFLEQGDLAEFEAEWVEPISTSYRGYEVCELPPNTQGLTVLEILNLMEGFDLEGMEQNSADYVHVLTESIKLAFADRAAFIADPKHVGVRVEHLASKGYAAQRRSLIAPDRAGDAAAAGKAPGGDTVYFAVVDRDRNAVSFINSLFGSFGSGIVAEGTGICLHNRGSGFSLDPTHPNRLAPRKRPFHTLIPAMVLRDQRPWLSFGVMGGDMQAQGHAQVLSNLIDFGMDIQEAGDAPRFRHDPGTLSLESAFPRETREALAARGHRVAETPGGFGGYQGILIDYTSGVLHGGSDCRKDGCALGW